MEKCRGCGDEGEVVCDCCKKYIFEHFENHCPVCKEKVEGGVCLRCSEVRKIFKGVYSVGYRDEFIGELVEEYKYYSVRGLARELGEILEKTAFSRLVEDSPEEFMEGGINKGRLGGNLGREILTVPLPTSRKHIRERGFDHTELILKNTGGAQIIRLLLRAKDTTQVGASEKKRLKQAKEAYSLNSKYFETFERRTGETRSGQIREKYREVLDRPIILFDDIWTTGASMSEAAKILREVGFKKIYGVVLAINRKGRKPVIRRGEFD